MADEDAPPTPGQRIGCLLLGFAGVLVFVAVMVLLAALLVREL